MLALLTSSSSNFGGRPSRRTLRSMWRPAPCAARVSLHISNLRDYSIPYPFPVGHGRIFPLTYHWTPTIPGQHCHPGGCGLVHLGHTVHSPAQIAFDQIVSRAPHEPCLPGVCNPPGYCLRPRASVFFPVLGVLLQAVWGHSQPIVWVPS